MMLSSVLLVDDQRGDVFVSEVADGAADAYRDSNIEAAGGFLDCLHALVDDSSASAGCAGRDEVARLFPLAGGSG